MHTYPKTLFDTPTQKPGKAALTGERQLIPVDKLISYRARAGRKMQARGETSIQKPTWISENFKDPTFKYFYRADEELFNSPILKQTGQGIEFAAFTLLNPGYLDILKTAAKQSKAKRRAKESFRERCAKSWPEKASGCEPLGNTGSNLDNFEKKTREKRYRIQKYIQKYRLAGNTVCTCGQPVADYITLKKNSDHGNINAGGIATCGSVWACPVCRAKIVNKRAKELKEIYQEGRKKDYKFHLITFTFPHSKHDNLAALYGSSTLRTGLAGAFTKFRQSRTWSKEFKKKMQLIGDVRSVEITWGKQNGFHPHIHLIAITEGDFNAEKWEKKFLKTWRKNCESSGLGIPSGRGVKVDPVRDAEMVTYLSKWSVGNELTSGPAKEGKAGNYSIAELEYFLIDDKARGSTRDGLQIQDVAGTLRAYYSAMHGQKQLVFGGKKGWKKELLNQDEQTDAEMAADEADNVRDVLILKKSLYQGLKKENIFSDFIESLESLDQNVPGYTDLLFKRAKAFLFQHYSGENIEMWRPGDDLIFDCQGY